MVRLDAAALPIESCAHVLRSCARPWWSGSVRSGLLDAGRAWCAEVAGVNFAPGRAEQVTARVAHSAVKLRIHTTSITAMTRIWDSDSEHMRIMYRIERSTIVTKK